MHNSFLGDVYQEKNIYILKNWKLRKNDVIYLEGNVYLRKDFPDGHFIYTGEVQDIIENINRFDFITLNSVYRCYYSDHNECLDDLILFSDESLHLEKQTAERFITLVQNETTQKMNDEIKRKKELFPDTCNKGIMLIFDNSEKHYFVDGVIRKGGETSVEGHAIFHCGMIKDSIIYQPDLELMERFRFFINNSYSIRFYDWSEYFGTVFIFNDGDTDLFVELYDKEYRIKPRHIVKMENIIERKGNEKKN